MFILEEPDIEKDSLSEIQSYINRKHKEGLEFVGMCHDFYVFKHVTLVDFMYTGQEGASMAGGFTYYEDQL